MFTILTENALLSEEGLLGKFLPSIAFIAANQTGEFSHTIVREASVLCLCRYMSVSSAVCERYLQLLFTLLGTESNAIRTTIVVALGDFAFRFPNTIEPWTANMYNCLSDSSLSVGSHFNLLNNRILGSSQHAYGINSSNSE